MNEESRETLFLALSAFMTAGTPAKIDGVLRTRGRKGLQELTCDLSEEKISTLWDQVTKLSSREIFAVLRGDPDFPQMLIHRGKCSAPVLFCLGNRSLLRKEGIGMCGSRAVSDLGLKAAVACGQEVSSRKLSVISGYAKGVDTATHLAALESGGTTVIVLAEGFDHFRIKQVFKEHFDPERVLVVSQFYPSQPWLSHAAMTRNAIIYGLGRALVVVEAGERGGTLAAGQGAIRMGRPVFVLNFGKDTPPGNRILLDRGGFPVESKESLGKILDMRPNPGAAQMSLPL